METVSDVIQKRHEKIESLKRSGLKDLLVGGTGIVTGGGAGGIGALGGTVSARTNIAEAHAQYMAYMEQVGTAWEEALPALESTVMGLASFADALFKLAPFPIVAAGVILLVGLYRRQAPPRSDTP